MDNETETKNDVKPGNRFVIVNMVNPSMCSPCCWWILAGSGEAFIDRFTCMKYNKEIKGAARYWRCSNDFGFMDEEEPVEPTK